MSSSCYAQAMSLNWSSSFGQTTCCSNEHCDIPVLVDVTYGARAFAWVEERLVWLSWRTADTACVYKFLIYKPQHHGAGKVNCVPCSSASCIKATVQRRTGTIVGYIGGIPWARSRKESSGRLSSDNLERVNDPMVTC